MKTIKLRENERLDDLQRNGYRIIQNPDKFCFGMDAVLLSGFANVRKKEKMLDLGTGTGIIPILMAAKTEGDSFTGLEIQPESADMAARSVQLNELENRVSIVEGDIREASALFGCGAFSVVTCNPPYMLNEHGLQNPNPYKAIARHEIACTLEDVLREGARLLTPKGRFYMVHRPFRLVEILTGFTAHGLEPKRLKFVQPFADSAPNMVLIEAVKGGNAGVIVEKPLIVYREPGVYMEEIYDIYGY